MKVLAINGAKTEKVVDSFGKQELYPNGTERVVKRYKLFRGLNISLEVCTVECVCGSDGTLYYNDWKRVKDIPNGEQYLMMVYWTKPVNV